MPVLLVWLFIAVLPVTSSAVTTVAQSGHLIRVWQTEDGLPQNTVNAITQTRDGFIWVGTLAGLARFDGLHFQVFDEVNAPGLSDEGISSLYEDTQGTLWIGHESGDVTCYRNSRFTPFSKGSPVSGRISQITEDDKGAIWLFRQNGTLERVGQFPAVILPSPDSALKTLALVRSPQGRIWVRIEGIASELKQGTIHPMDFGPAHHTNYVRGLGASNDGGLWVVCDSIVRKWKDEHWTEERGTWGNSDISTIKELHNGILAIGTMESGFHLRYPNGKTLTFDYQHGLIQNWVHLLYEDREGNLWVAAGSGGLVMIRPTPFETLNAPDNWQGRTVLSVTPGKEGDLWIGTEGAGLYNHHEGKWKHYSAAEGISRPYVWSLATNSSGQVWAGTWDGDILHLEGEHFLRTPELDPVGSPVMTLHFDAVDGSLWAGTRNGLLHWKNGEKSWHLRDPTGNQPKIVFGVFPDGRDNLWLALADAGVGYLHAGESKVHELNGGWTAGSVQCLLVDGNTLWIGTQNNGLSRLKDGHITSISANQGLASRVICHMEDDGKGYLWLSTHHGIIRVAKSELNRCADGEITTVISQTFDKDDGLPTIEYRRGLQAGCQTADGRIWFTSSKGLVSVDPGALISNTQPPPVVIESMLIDGRLLPESALQQLPPSHERIEFRFTALSFAAPNKVQFKYQLEGLDQGWIESGNSRTAFYSHLAPGSYRFQVIASNNDGVWNATGRSLSFVVVPAYWQTWWFRSLLALFAAVAGGWIVRQETRRRMQRRLNELEYERGIEQERTRIAQDIHDDIGSSLTRIMMLSQPLHTEREQPQHATTMLDNIHDIALEVTHTLDEIVWAVNPHHDTLDSLVNYISRLAQETLVHAGIACRIDLPMNLPPWPLKAQVRYNLLLAFKEVLTNILKHAHATEVHVSLILQENAFVITVQDNGSGQNIALVDTLNPRRPLGGNGLENVRRRLSQIGGSCEMRAVAGEGWRVIFTVIMPGEGIKPALVNKSGSNI